MKKIKLLKIIQYKRRKGYLMECWHCKKPFEVDQARYNTNKCFFCSRRCSFHSLPHPGYKGRIKRDGYWYIRAPEHPQYKGKKQPYIAEHRLVMERMIGRFLDKKEIVHHINGDITDNRPENLELFKNAGEHIWYAHTDRDSVTGRFVSKKSKVIG